MKRPYRVEVSKVVYVMAEDEIDSVDVGIRAAFASPGGWESMANLSVSARMVPPDALDAPIYNGDGETVREALAMCEGR